MDKLKEENNLDKKEKSGSSDLRSIFQRFSLFGDRESDGEAITLKNIEKWMEQANLLGGKSKISNADTAITFAKIAKMRFDFGNFYCLRTSKRLSLDEFFEFLNELAANKNLELRDLIDQLVNAEEPELYGVTTPVTAGVIGANVKRLTNPSLYTGIHKERFDEEGQGRGIEGREDITDGTGYVQGYKNKDTYDEKFKME